MKPTKQPKFFFRDLKLRGIPYQHTGERQVDLGTYTCKLDGSERRRIIGWNPKSDAMRQAGNKVERTLARGLGGRRPLQIRRYAFKLWFKAANTEPMWMFFAPDVKLKILNRFMYLVRKYIVSGRYMDTYTWKRFGYIIPGMLTEAKTDTLNELSRCPAECDCIPMR